MNRTARLEFAAIFRAFYERTELISTDFEQLDCGPATGLEYFLQKEKISVKRKRNFVSGDENGKKHLPRANICSSQLA